MTYTVKEIFKTLQGEGAQAGRPAVFCRFTGCNLWSGREQDRGDGDLPILRHGFCRHRRAGRRPLRKRRGAWRRRSDKPGRANAPRRFVVFTGGEPLLQLDAALIEAVHRLGFEIAVETNGTQDAGDGIDWICVSPKAGAPLEAA